ncbi:hypothetical protein B0H63DRAFT_234702 [Podospora didyma]|uniref:Uncharacterized protein n=1 Tax=Podospora didyma TaxID=330526 RepID=A0AAE0KJZ1_9PEZI|nr:hypothetical protein B0H63DRAFT_234702 [Podospora didyma]
MYLTAALSSTKHCGPLIVRVQWALLVLVDDVRSVSPNGQRLSSATGPCCYVFPTDLRKRWWARDCFCRVHIASHRQDCQLHAE